ncbi:xanthine dehydrogenase family protein molybdopterin-binding subunit [Rhodopila sp.]|uniref:xanthine dehydrogenase family protein molybdopterin-binding subunit n=1 Tax=Rhodopila sp. TaxID=2480087 RepID=UPI003D0DB0A5
MDGMTKRLFPPSGRDRVTGRTSFSFDIALPNMLHGKLLRSPHAHARIRHIDTTAARAIPGVAAVLTGQDTAQLADPFYGVGLRDQPLIATDRVRYVGDTVAAVVAGDEITAFRAAQAIVVDYQVLPALMTPQDALVPDAPALFDQPAGGGIIAVGQGSTCIGEPAKNVLCDYTFGYGDVDAALAASAAVYTDSFGFSRIHHFHLEPHVNVARWIGDRLEMWSCNQDPFVIRADIARVFGLPLHNVCLHTPPIGGGFGGKSYCKMEPLVALMAYQAGAPVRLGLTFDESILTTTKHAAILTLTTGVDSTGRLTARRADIVLDGGAYADASVTVAIKAGFRAGGPYRWAAIDSRARVVRTTCVPGGSFRGFGGTQSSWASESQIDMIARRQGLDPFAFRMRNFLAVQEPFAPGDSGMDADLRAGLTEVAERLGRPGPCPPGRGRGFAVGLKDAGGTGNHAQALIKVTQGGEAIISAAVVEIGQGAGTALCRIAAETLGLPPENVVYSQINTDHTPPDNGTHVSCGTTVTGLAVEAAARDVRRQIIDFVADQLGCEAASVVLDGWTARIGNHVHPLEPMIRAWYGGIGWEFIGRGAFKEPYDAAAPLRSKTMAWMPCWSGAEVEVDRETGQVRLHRLVVGADAGRAVDLLACHGQIEGAAIQAVSQALFEELRYDGSAPGNATPRAYRVAQTPDLPAEFVSFVAEHGLGRGPGKLKGIGEAGILGVAACIANAIEDAAGIRLTSLPFTPEKVLAALDARVAGTGTAE